MAEPYHPTDRLHLWWLEDPAQPQLVGDLTLVDRGRGVALHYSPEWLTGGFPLSEDLPLHPVLHMPRARDLAAGAVDDARPDRWGERVIRKFEATPRLSLLEFLLFAGDDRYGALGVSTSAQQYLPWQRGPMPGLDSLQEMAEVVRKVLANEPVPELQRRLVKPGASLGGARPKSLIGIDGEPWLVKFAEGEDIDTPLIEHATMALARRCGIDVAATRAFPIAGGHTVAVRRFDREGTRRLHAVSARVALTAAGEELGYPQLAQLLRRLAPAGRIREQQEQLFRRMVFNILVDNTDDHEKNHALLRQPDGHYVLSPAFDIVPSAQGLGYQQLLVGDAGAESTLENALSQSLQFGLKKDRAAALVREIAAGVDGWRDHFQNLKVRPSNVDVLGQYLDGANLGHQRAQALKPPAP